ncbi:MAG: hypothetical protein ACTS5A_03465 [Candidatus Hodgkinia cicadicola]
MTKRSIDHSSRSKSTDRTSSLVTSSDEGGRVPNHCCIRSVVSFEKNPFERLINLNKLPTTYDPRVRSLIQFARECTLPPHLRTRRMLTIFNHFRRSVAPLTQRKWSHSLRKSSATPNLRVIDFRAMTFNRSIKNYIH